MANRLEKIEMYWLVFVVLAGFMFFVTVVEAEEYNIYGLDEDTGLQEIHPQGSIVVEDESIEIYENDDFGNRPYVPKYRIERERSDTYYDPVIKTPSNVDPISGQRLDRPSSRPLALGWGR